MKSRSLKFVIPAAVSLLLMLCVIIFGQPFSARADSYVNEDGKTIIDTNWWFENIDVNIEVRENKTLAVTETLKVGFIKGGKNTGIIRDIQRISETTRIINGEKKRGKMYIAELDDVNVTINGKPAKVTRSLYDMGQFHSVKMQLEDGAYFPATDQDHKDESLNTFVLSYVYDMSADKINGCDDFTFDLLGYAMDFTRKFHARVTFPKEIDLSRVTFRTNKMKEFAPDAEKGESVVITENTVEINATPNKEHVGYTVQVLLDDGYFKPAPKVRWYYFVFLAVAFAGIAFGTVVFLKFAPRKPVETVEFYPPNGMRALRYSAVWHGKARPKDIAAVITQWADEGCVKIERDGDKELSIHRLKELPPHVPKKEKGYFNAMFKYGNTFSTRAARLSSNSALERAYNALETEAETPAPFVKNKNKAHALCTVSMVIPFLALFVYYCILCAHALPMFFLVFIAAGAGVGAVQASIRISPIAYVFPVMFTAMPTFAFYSIFYIPMYDYGGLLFIALMWYFALYILTHFMKRRSDSVMGDYGKMIGFKNFLLKAELPRIEALFDDDPDYFSHIIPYLLVMDISDRVEHRFRALKVAPPEWASGIPLSALSSMSRSVASSATSHSSSGGGGGGGRGGSSGGGGGGGGSRGC